MALGAWGLGTSMSQCWGLGSQCVPVQDLRIPASPSAGAMGPSVSQCRISSARANGPSKSQCSVSTSQHVPVPGPWVSKSPSAGSAHPSTSQCQGHVSQCVPAPLSARDRGPSVSQCRGHGSQQLPVQEPCTPLRPSAQPWLPARPSASSPSVPVHSSPSQCSERETVTQRRWGRADGSRVPPAPRGVLAVGPRGLGRGSGHPWVLPAPCRAVPRRLSRSPPILSPSCARTPLEWLLAAFSETGRCPRVSGRKNTQC